MGAGAMVIVGTLILLGTMLYMPNHADLGGGVGHGPGGDPEVLLGVRFIVPELVLGGILHTVR